MVAAAGMGEFSDDSLLESADGQPILIDSRFSRIEPQGIEVCSDVGPQRLNHVLALVPTHRAAHSCIVCLYDPGQ